MEKLISGRTLIFFTSTFPYGTGEAFIENEIRYLSSAFDKVIIVTNATDCNLQRPIPENVTVLMRPYSLNLRDKISSVKHLLSSEFLAEIFRLRKQYGVPINLTVINTALQSIQKSKKLLKFLKEHLPVYIIEGSTICYSYWADDNAVALALLKKQGFPFKAICRAHRWDIYFEKNGSNYLPLRNTLAEQLNRMFFVSENGKQYFESRIGSFPSLKTSFLGVTPIPSSKSESECLHILSCSNVIERKRVIRIAQALAIVNKNVRIKWTHIGEGEQFDKLNEFCTEICSQNKLLQIDLKRALPNKAVKEFYLTHKVDLFVNVSASEGIPVSIMEAMSAYTPVIATDVDGNGEIVQDQYNGFLLSPDFTNEHLAALIEKCANTNLQPLRENAYNTWNEKFNADKNYSNFVKEILSL